MNILIKNALTILSEENHYITKRVDIAIKDDIIFAIDEIPSDFMPDETIDSEKYLASAGLINCHTHSYMSLYRNYADDLSFSDWLFGKIDPLENKTTPDDAYYGALLSCIEMIRTGTTTFTDMHMFRNMTAKAADEAGMRAVISRGLVGEDENFGGAKRLDEAFEEMENYKDNRRISFMLAPHAIYTCNTEYLKKIIGIAIGENIPLNIHLSETRYEVSEALKNYGKTPTEYLDSIGFFEQKTLAAHCVHLTDNDIEILAKNKVSVAANPISNLKLGNGFAPIPKLMEKGVNICIGTDSAASNNSLNLFRDMNYTALIHKGVNEEAQCVSAEEVYRFATKNGADALSLYNTGELRVGKKADIILLDLNSPSLNPYNNPVSALSYSVNGSEVDTVIIDGKIVMRKKQLLTIDEEQVYYNVNKIIRRLSK